MPRLSREIQPIRQAAPDPFDDGDAVEKSRLVTLPDPAIGIR